MTPETPNAVVVVGSYNFNFVARNRQRAIELTEEVGRRENVPDEVVSYITKSIYGMTLTQEDTLIEVKAEGHMPQLTGNSSQLGNAIISVRAIPVRD